MSRPKTDADIARMGVRDTRAALDRDVATIRDAAARLRGIRETIANFEETP